MRYDRPEHYDAWAAEIQRIADLHESGRLEEADAAWAEVIPATVLDLDRSILLINRATTLTALGRLADAEACYDQASAIEHRWMRGYARESKAVWLATHGRNAEALDVYRRLHDEPWVGLADRRRVAANIAHLEGLVGDP